MEIPGAWYVEDSNGKLTKVRHEGAVQHVREALTVRPYGQREKGLDFAFELLVYWWTNFDGQVLPSPSGVVGKIQDHQFESLKQAFPGITFHTKEADARGGREVSVLTVETSVPDASVPDATVRFKNLAFEQKSKVYSLTVGYPAHEELAWSKTLERVLSRWTLE
jgi:hypothetical protein